MTRALAIAALGMVCATAAGAHILAAAQKPADTVPIVAVAGCLTERAAGTWVLTQATDPAPSVANAPTAKTPYSGPTTGKHEFALLGVSEFDLPAHKGHTVLIKALHIKATPTDRLNVTSVTHLAPSCPPPAK